MKLIVFALSLLSFYAGQPATGAAAKALQGRWDVISLNGQAAPGEGAILLVIKGDKYEQVTKGEVTERGSLKLDEKAKPMTIDLAITEGNDTGKLQPGLFEIKGDTLLLSLASPGNPRPTTLDGAELKLVLKRMPAGK